MQQAQRWWTEYAQSLRREKENSEQQKHQWNHWVHCDRHNDG